MELHLGHKLCKVREPDFLLDIIKQQVPSFTSCHNLDIFNFIIFNLVPQLLTGPYTRGILKSRRHGAVIYNGFEPMPCN